jgi:hypothetical protein
VYDGREAIEKEYAAFFSKNPGLQMATTISSVKMIGDHAAIETGTTLLTKADKGIVSRGSYAAVHVKESGKWLLASVQEFPSPSRPMQENVADLEWLIGDWTATHESTTLEFAFKWIADKKFVELSYSVRNKDSVARSGIQIIGNDPGTGELISWSFDSNGGSGYGRWMAHGKGWIIDSLGMIPDGTVTNSTELLSRTEADSFTWRSVNRWLDGQKLNDSRMVTLKRKQR